MEERPKKKRGPKGGIKHRPGRRHDRKSAPGKKAIRTLWQSRELCELHGIKFDGKDLLRDFLAEYGSTRAAR
jgi:hypothetical protein